MSNRALLIGSSFSAAPILFGLRRRGLHITVIGKYKDDPCHQYGDASIFEDYSDKQKFLEIVETGNYDFIVPSCNDFAYVSGNWAANKLGFPGFDTLETTEILHTKAQFRAFCESIDLPAPRRIAFGDAQTVGALSASDLTFPVLVKPVDSFSGRGMTKLHSPEGLALAIQLAATESRSGEVVVEHFHAGDLYSHTAFVEDGQIFWDEFVDEFCTVYPYQVDCSNCPSRLPSGVKSEVRSQMQRLISALKLCDGLLHTQFIFDGDRFWIIECMRRGPGDLYPQLIERATGAPYTDMYLSKFLGERYPTDLTRSGEYRALVGRHTISTATAVVASGFETHHTAKTLAFVPLKLSADRMEAAPYDKMGILFLEYDAVADLHQASPTYADLFRPTLLETLYG